jgi:hypothetical protein
VFPFRRQSNDWYFSPRMDLTSSNEVNMVDGCKCIGNASGTMVGAAGSGEAATPNREKRMAETFAAAANLARLQRKIEVQAHASQ